MKARDITNRNTFKYYNKVVLNNEIRYPDETLSTKFEPA